MTGRIRGQLAIGTVLFLGASAVHTGLLVAGYEHARAATAELVIGLVLAAGLVLGVVRPARVNMAALVAEAFAVVGTLVGLFTIAIGVGPRTLADIALHVVMLAVLGWGLITAWSARGGRRRETAVSQGPGPA